ncbi:hypothetical protein [Enterobacter mori]
MKASSANRYPPDLRERTAGISIAANTGCHTHPIAPEAIAPEVKPFHLRGVFQYKVYANQNRQHTGATPLAGYLYANVNWQFS